MAYASHVTVFTSNNGVSMQCTGLAQQHVTVWHPADWRSSHDHAIRPSRSTGTVEKRHLSLAVPSAFPKCTPPFDNAHKVLAAPRRQNRCAPLGSFGAVAITSSICLERRRGGPVRGFQHVVVGFEKRAQLHGWLHLANPLSSCALAQGDPEAMWRGCGGRIGRRRHAGL